MTSPTLQIRTPSASPPRGRIAEFDLLRAACCLGVILIHITGYYQAFPRGQQASHEIFFLALANEGVRFALFGFMFLSGLLLTLRHGGKFRAGTFLGKRVRTVLVPYFVWLAVYFLLTLAGQVLRKPHQPLALLHLLHAFTGSVPDIKQVAGWVLFGTWAHLYFINMLFQMYFLYAIFNRPIGWLLATHRRALTMVAVIALLYPAWVYFRFVPFLWPGVKLPMALGVMTERPNSMAFEWLAPFALGLYCGAYREQFLAWVRRWAVWLALLMLTALAAMTAISASPFLIEQAGRFGMHGRLLTAVLPVMEAVQDFVPMKLHLLHLAFPFPRPQNFLQPVFRLVYAFCFNALALLIATRVCQRLGEERPAWLRAALSFAAVSFGVYLLHPLLLQIFRVLPPPGIAPLLYAQSGYLYLLVVTVLATGISYAVVVGITAAGRRWKPLGWLPGILFGDR